jgi:hypothetical protein
VLINSILSRNGVSGNPGAVHNAIRDGYVLNALNRFKPQPCVEVIDTPKRLKLKDEPKANVARYDALLKKLAVAAIAAMPMLMAAASNRIAEVPYGTP